MIIFSRQSQFRNALTSAAQRYCTHRAHVSRKLYHLEFHPVRMFFYKCIMQDTWRTIFLCNLCDWRWLLQSGMTGWVDFFFKGNTRLPGCEGWKRLSE